MPSLVTNMGQHKTPWEDVPVEVLIEFERKKRKELEDHRERLRLPLYSPAIPAPTKAPEDQVEEDYKIVIDFI
jgi:hypothetical protein